MKSPVISICWLLAFLGCLLVSPIESVLAENERQVLKVGQVLSDGKDGRVWRQWRQNIAEKPLARVEVVVQRISGGNDTFLNLRYGSGQSFEDGKQAFLTNNDSQTLSWHVGAAPLGQPLVLNAYKGEVRVDRVILYSQGGIRTNVQPWGGRGSVGQSPTNNDDRRGGGRFDEADSSIEARCRRARRLRSPKIEVGKAEASGGLFSGKYKISGSMFGACIEEAGYFENGRLKAPLDFPLSDAYKRQEFEFRVKTGKNGELRIYSMNGQEDVVFVDEVVAESQSIYR